MGFVPHTYQPERPSLLPEIDKQKEDLWMARVHAQKAMRRAGELHSKQTKWTPYVKGQRVWLEGTHLSTLHPFTKLRPKRFGPFQIIETLGPVTYRLNLSEKWKIHNAFYATLLSPYVETKEHGVNFTEPPPDLIGGEPEWEVEKILGSRRHRQKKTLEYLVKWKRYSAVHNSWEPANNVHAPELLEEFYSEEPMAIRTAQIGKQIQCLSSPQDSTSSLESLSATSTSASPTKSPPITEANTGLIADMSTALSMIDISDDTASDSWSPWLGLPHSPLHLPSLSPQNRPPSLTYMPCTPTP
jgi:hypothetical protein